jgi:hypothetical protein
MEDYGKTGQNVFPIHFAFGLFQSEQFIGFVRAYQSIVYELELFLGILQ